MKQAHPTTGPIKRGQKNEDTEIVDAGQLMNEDGILEIQESCNFDEYIARTFVITGDINEPRNVGCPSSVGVTVMQDVININITFPTGERRVITVWGKNSHNIYQYFM